MKIIYLTNVRLPTEKAHGLQIMKMCEAFSSEKDSNGNLYEVELVVPRRFNPIKENAYNYYNIKNNFRITRVPCVDLTSFGFGSIGYWIQVTTFLISAKLLLLFKRFDILYTREFAVSLFFSKCVLEIHDIPKKITKWHLQAWHEAQKLIVLTSFLKSGLVEKGIESNKIQVCPDAVDLNEFNISISKAEARERFSIPKDKKVVMYTGSFFFYGWKGVDTLIEVAEKLPPNVSVVLVGGSEKEIQNIKSSKNISENILLIGRVKHQEIPYLLKSADVLVLPNKAGDNNSERYTSPLKLFEYMASGVPIIASDLPSIREVLNEENCTFFGAGDIASLIATIQSVLSNSDVTNKKAYQAFNDVQSNTWLKRAQNILQFIYRK